MDFSVADLRLREVIDDDAEVRLAIDELAGNGKLPLEK
jgi:hypothetical protein